MSRDIHNEEPVRLVTWWNQGGFYESEKPPEDGEVLKHLTAVDGPGDPPRIRARIRRHVKQGWFVVHIEESSWSNGAGGYRVEFFILQRDINAYLATAWLQVRLSIMANRNPRDC